jgi:hypothetical protein
METIWAENAKTVGEVRRKSEAASQQRKISVTNAVILTFISPLCFLRFAHHSLPSVLV